MAFLPDALVSRKHTVLLVVIMLAEALQQLATTQARGVLFDFFVILLVLLTFLVVFEEPLQRAIGLFLGAGGIVSNWAHYVLSGPALVASEVLHHAFMCAFFIFAAVAILRGIFQRKAVNADAVVGAVCGYLLSGASFSNLYAVLEVVSPGAFAVNAAIAGQLQDWHARRFLFGYFSLVTMTSMGYGYITPVQPPAQSLTWIESVFGQFYLAVVVSQLVGMRLTPKPNAAPPLSHEKGA